MITPFSQSKTTYKISFSTYYKDIEAFENLFSKDDLNISFYEIDSKTIESLPYDIWCFEVFFNQQPNIAILTQIKDFAEVHTLKILSDINLEKVEDQDWVSFYQSNLKPIEIGRFFISARDHKEFCPPHKKGIFIDASRAFGTGEHHTTASCIEALEKLTDQYFNNILDIGSGTGILSFAAESIWPNARILGCDIEEAAVMIAQNNADFNNSKVIFYQNSIDNILSSQFQDLKFDLVISNILADPLVELAPKIRQLTTKNAYVILSGFLESQRQKVFSAFEENGFELNGIIQKEGWVTIIIKVKVN